PLADAQSYGSGEICRLLKEKGGMLCESARMRNAASNSFNQHDYEIDGSEIDLGTSKVIGEGSFGEVRLASWRGTPIAVKVLRDEYAANPAALNEFRQELRILQSLRHPNIVQFLGAVTKSRPRMIVTEYLKVNLRDVIRKKGALPAHEALRYALDVARGMCYLHAHRPDPVIHRDLTPSNLLRDDSGHLKVADFGLASIRATAAAPPSSSLGTGMGLGMGATNIVSLFQPNFSRRLTFSKHSHRLYSAPELLAQQEYDKSVDLLPGGTNHGGNLFPLALSSSGHSYADGGAEGGAGGSHHSGGGSHHGGGSLRGSEGEAAPEAARPPDIAPPVFTRRTYPMGMKELITDCRSGDPAVRPSFARIIEILEQIQEEMNPTGKSAPLLCFVTKPAAPPLRLYLSPPAAPTAAAVSARRLVRLCPAPRAPCPPAPAPPDRAPCPPSLLCPLPTACAAVWGEGEVV
ncbi:unnamed protein product, partial [Closterium sp. Naga37s-1]